MASVMSNRLYEQLNNLSQFKHPILVIVEENKWKDFYFSKSRYVHKQYIGTLTTLVAKYPNIKVVHLDSDDEFVDFIDSLYNKLTSESKSSRPTLKSRKPKNMKEEKENVLSQISGVGIPLSKKLLKEYKSINGVANASEKDLCTIEKLGKKTASRILEVLN